jgi:hypothetical protein
MCNIFIIFKVKMNAVNVIHSLIPLTIFYSKVEIEIKRFLSGSWPQN